MGNAGHKLKVLMIDSLVGNDYTICLCSALAEAGVDIILVVPEQREIRSSVQFKVKYLAPTKSSGFNKIKKAFDYLRYLMEVLRQIKEEKIDIVHYQFFRRERIESFYFCLLRLLGINLVYTAHNVLPHEKQRIDLALKPMVYRSAEAIIAHSQFIKTKLVNTFNVDAKKIKVIPHGNFDIYLPEKRVTKCESRNELKIAESAFILLFFGTIRENKGLDILLDAFELLGSRDERFRLLITGRCQNAKHENEVVLKISKLKTADQILFFPGFIPNEKVATFFLAADVVVLPYKEIYHSGILHLAYSFGRPVIATRVGDFEEVIVNEKEGYILEKNNHQCLAETIQKAFCDPDKLEHMGKIVRHISETKYSWRDIARQTKDLYRSIITEPLP
jgi:glycosyltransferase involved in cell wall biosynthesis